MKKLLILLIVLLMISCPWSNMTMYEIVGFQAKETESEWVFSWKAADFSQTDAALQKWYERNTDYLFKIEIPGIESETAPGALPECDVATLALVYKQLCGKETSVAVPKERLPQGVYKATIEYKYTPEAMSYAGICFKAALEFEVK